jgi:hypothetical protein
MLKHIIEFFKSKIQRKKNKNLAIGHYVPNKTELVASGVVNEIPEPIKKVIKMVSVIEEIPEANIHILYYQHEDKYIISQVLNKYVVLRGFDFSQIDESISNIYDNGEFVFDMNNNYLSVFKSIYQVNPYGEEPFILRVEFNNEIFYVEKEDELSRIKPIK